MIDIISHLKRDNYDYLPLCKRNRIDDDSRTIQRRMDSGLDPFKHEEGCDKGFLIKETLRVPSGFNVIGR